LPGANLGADAQVFPRKAEGLIVPINHCGVAAPASGDASMSKIAQSDRYFGGLPAMPRAGLSLLEKSNLIEGTQWANELSYPQIKKLAAYMDVYKVPKETMLFYEGDKSTFLVLIVKGQVHVVKFDSNHEPKRIATLGPGKTIGEMTLIDGEPRSASAITATDATLMVMTMEHFNRLVDEWPRVAIILVLKIAKLVSQYLRQTSGRLIDHVDK
jgi:CRP/FNR family transcriptional regulator, cyclic AMP receptor protein